MVTKDIPDYALALGNPAKVVGWVNEKGDKLAFDSFGKVFAKVFI